MNIPATTLDDRPVQVRGVSRRHDEFLSENTGLETPFLVLDLDIVAERYRALRAALPEAMVHFAVKANPAQEVLDLLAGMGCRFDVASPGEIERCVAAGADPATLSYGNTIKKDVDIGTAVRCGVRMFTVDSGAELDKLLRRMHEGTVFVRIATDGAGADWPLSRKFGCSVGEAAVLAERATRHGLDVGFSFHVGSQQRQPDAWGPPLAAVAELLDGLVAVGGRPGGVNIGGGLPSSYVAATPGIEDYGVAIRELLGRHLGRHLDRHPTMPIIVEPGRYLVGDAGVIETEVVLISERDVDPDRRWVYLDVGLFNGLTETLGEAIRYRIRCPEEDGPRAGRPRRSVVRQRRRALRAAPVRPADGVADRRPDPAALDGCLHVVVLVGVVQRLRAAADVRARGDGRRRRVMTAGRRRRPVGAGRRGGRCS